MPFCFVYTVSYPFCLSSQPFPLFFSHTSVEECLIEARIDEANSPTFLKAENAPPVQLVALFVERHLRPEQYFSRLDTLTIDFGANNTIEDFQTVQQKCNKLVAFKLLHSNHPNTGANDAIDVYFESNKIQAEDCGRILAKHPFRAVYLDIDTTVVSATWFYTALKHVHYRTQTKLVSLDLKNGCDESGARLLGDKLRANDSGTRHLRLMEYQGEEKQTSDDRKFFANVQHAPGACSTFNNLVELLVSAEYRHYLTLSPILQFMKEGSGRSVRALTLAYMELNDEGYDNLGNIAELLGKRQASVLILHNVYIVAQEPDDYERPTFYAVDKMKNTYGKAQWYRCKGNGRTYLIFPHQKLCDDKTTFDYRSLVDGTSFGSNQGLLWEWKKQIDLANFYATDVENQEERSDPFDANTILTSEIYRALLKSPGTVQKFVARGTEQRG